MLRNIEKAFNMIWRTRENRSAVSSFLLYWAVLSLAPLTIGMALGISTYLASLAVMFEDYDVMGAGSALLGLAPYLLSVAGFTLIYAAVPNCRVPFRHALLGGALAALAFNVARRAFTDLVVGSSYTFIYGAFAAVPLFLLWIYISWNIVLMGGILVHSMSAYQTLEEAARPTVLKALDVLYLLWSRQKTGEAVRESELIGGKTGAIMGLDSETWRDLRKTFLDNNLIAENDRGRYLLARDLHQVHFWQIKELINEELPLEKEDIAAHLPWQEEAYRLLRDQRGQQRELLGTSLAELFAR
jgi:membrane protein